MIDLQFDLNEAEAFVRELVPSYQQIQILAVVVDTDPPLALIEETGMRLVEEKGTATFIGPTKVGGAASGTMNPAIWSAVKSQVYDLFCTDSDQYAEQRKEGVATEKNLITIVATAVAAHFSLPLGVMVGAVTLCLMCALKVGRNAYCETHKPATNE
jgi:hypothetical protein